MGYQALASNMDQEISAPIASSMPSHVTPQVMTPIYPMFNSITT
jgi:hypothetical protein